MITDHINRNKLDNRGINLRAITKADNARNRMCKFIGKTYEDMDNEDKKSLEEHKKYLKRAYYIKNRERLAAYDRERYKMSKDGRQT